MAMPTRKEQPEQGKKPLRVEVLMAGIGGKGVLFAGQLLADSAVDRYPHVAWFPSYATQMRGGPCECTTVISETPIATPVLFTAETVIVMVVSQLSSYLGRVAPGGLLITESVGLKDGITRDDIRVMKVPAFQTALDTGGGQAANLVLLGAYLGASGTIPPELVEEGLRKKTSRWGDTFNRNRDAFRRGIELGAAQKV